MSNPQPDGDHAALARDLAEAVRGEVGFDAGSRALYTVDASVYRQVPVGVVWPASSDDVVRAVEVCRRHGVPVLSRGGGTSLAGQTCNVAVVLDFSRHLDRVLEIDPERRLARVQPGCVLDVLRDAAESHGLTFGPDPATHASCTLGGMLGNNACGIHSVMAGRTADNVRSLEVLTYDGERMRVGATSEEELAEIVAAGGRRGEIYAALVDLRDRYAELVREKFPDIPRRVSGFNLDELLPENGFHVARALVGSEGTCVTILEAELELVPWPPSRALVTVAFDSLPAAADHVPELMAVGEPGLDLIGCEALDLALLAGADTELLPDLAGAKDDAPEGGWMILELGADDAAAVAAKARDGARRLDALPAVRDVRVFTGEEERRRIWKLRESGIAATKRTASGANVWPGWEDSAVAPERLGDYLRDLRRLMDEHGLEGSFYGHFGQGCVHLRLTFDLATEEGLATYRRFAYEAAELVTRYGGSLSGEHGDGQARGELLPLMYGEELTRAFGELKAIWDPAGRMNPGKVVDPYPLDTNLRLGPGHEPWEPETAFAYPDDGGSFAHAAGRCVGVGRCRSLEGGTMCPSYRATGEERHSTRGRAHLLFEMLEGGVDGVDGVELGGWDSREVKEALDLCLACKACKSECPVKVDMATYKAEFLHHHYQGHRRPRTAYTFGRIHDWARLASLAPRLVNAATHLPGLAGLAKKVAGVAPRREVPRFASSTFRRRFARRPRATHGRPVTLFIDTFTDHFHPEIGEAAVDALEALGYWVEIPGGDLCCGRPLYDYGFLDRAKGLLRTAIDALSPSVERGVPVVGLEPSCTAAFRDELVSFFPDDPAARAVAANFLTLGELLRRDGGKVDLPSLEGRAVVHGHCHHEAVMGLDPEVELLAGLGLDVDVLDAGCCGMAGSFGFEADKYDVSMACGERVLLPAVRAAAGSTLVVSDGFSCREQIRQATGRRALHTAEVLARAANGRPVERPERKQGGNTDE